MPVTKSAIKKLRRDKKITINRKSLKDKLERSLSKAKKEKSKKAIQEAQSIVDKAIKINLVNKNKGARIKSQLFKMVKPTTIKKKISRKKKTLTTPPADSSVDEKP